MFSSSDMGDNYFNHPDSQCFIWSLSIHSDVFSIFIWLSVVSTLNQLYILLLYKSSLFVYRHSQLIIYLSNHSAQTLTVHAIATINDKYSLNVYGRTTKPGILISSGFCFWNETFNNTKHMHSLHGFFHSAHLKSSIYSC